MVQKGRVWRHFGQYPVLNRLKAQSSISLISCKKLGSNYKLRGQGPHKATVTGTNCKFRGFPRTTLKFDNLLAGLTELTGSYCIYDYIYYSKKLKPKTRQRNRYAGPKSFICPLPKELMDSVTFSWFWCILTKEAHPQDLVFRVCMEVSLQRQYWIIAHVVDLTSTLNLMVGLSGVIPYRESSLSINY